MAIFKSKIALVILMIVIPLVIFTRSHISDADFMALCVASTPQGVAKAIQKGANLEARDENQYTPLMFATANPNPEVLKILLDAGADVEAKAKGDITPLMVAALNNPDPEVVKILLERGANPHAKTNQGESVLDVLKERKLPRKGEIEKLLKEAMAKNPEQKQGNP